MNVSANTLISKLIEKTKNKNYSWKYLSNNLPLYKKVEDLIPKHNFLNYPPGMFGYKGITDNKSFYIEFKDGFIVLVDSCYYEMDDLLNYIFLIVVPSIDSKNCSVINQYNEYQTELTRLVNLAIRQYPNTEDFLEDFINS